MTKLHLSLEHAGTGSDSPGNNWLGNDAVLDRFDDTVLFNTTDFSEQQENLALRIGLVSQQVINKRRARVSVAANCDTFIDTICVVANNVVQLVGHAARLGDVADGALSVQLGCHNVVHHATSVADLECARLDAADGGGSDDCDALFLCGDHDLTSSSFWHTFGNDGNRPDLWYVHQLH